MFNKTKLKSYIKRGKKETFTFDVNQGWFSDGYSIYQINDESLTVLNELFCDHHNITILKGKVESDKEPLNLTKVIEDSCKNTKELKITPYSLDISKDKARVFIDSDGNEILCNQRFLDVFDHYKNYTYASMGKRKPICVFKEEEIIGLLLPLVNIELDYLDYRIVKK